MAELAGRREDRVATRAEHRSGWACFFGHAGRGLGESQVAAPRRPDDETTCFVFFSFVTHTGRSAQRLEADVDRAVQNLETRIRRLLSAAAGAGGDEEDDSSTGSSPPASSMQRKGNPYPSEGQGSAGGAGAGAGATGVEVETHLV